MAGSADIGTKRLVSLSPTAWARWLTGDATVEAEDVLSGEFQWVSRANDVLVRARSAKHGEFLIANEIQFRPDKRMARRMRAYTALAEERYRLNVYPVLVNVLPPGRGTPIADHYRSEFMGLVARQDYKVINLWQQDVNLVFEHNLTTLLPFVPVLQGGQDEAIVRQAVTQLRASEEIAELEPLLAFFASFVLESDLVRRIMRWDMKVLRESPWYVEILEEGREEGLEEGREEGRDEGREEILLRILERRFGPLPPALKERIGALHEEQLLRLADAVFDVTSTAELEMRVATLQTKGEGES